MIQTSADLPMSIFMIAGEASADLHGASLAREFKELYPRTSFFGVGGDRLRRENMEILYDSSRLNVVGLTELGNRLFDIWKTYRSLLRTIDERKPQLAILLDLPDFNLMMAKQLKRRGIPVVYYISPQVWAWRTYRVNKIRKFVDRMLVLFPFEEEFYRRHSVQAEFVGHPLLDSVSPRRESRSQSEVVERPRIALLPGSRNNELHYHGDLLRETVAKVRQRFPHAEFRVPVASTLTVEKVRSAIPDSQIQFETGNSYGVLEWADVALVASGTATLETALIGTPFCLFYRVSALNAFLFNLLSGYRGPIGMPNLLLDKPFVSEFYQQKATSDALAQECIRLVEDGNYRENLALQLRLCRERLGQTGASHRAARSVFDFLGTQSLLPGGNFATLPAHT